MDSNKFYVYIHTDTNGTIFYVGKGCGRRFNSNSQRSKKWKNRSSNGFFVSKVAENLDEQSAYELEKELIAYFYPFGNLVNVYSGGGPIGQSILFKGRKISDDHKINLTKANRSYKRERYDKSSVTLSKGTWVTPKGSFHSLRLAAIENDCSIMTVRNKCLGYTAKRKNGEKIISPENGWTFYSISA